MGLICASKKNTQKFATSSKTAIFAPLFNRKPQCLDYGVMVAQQVLVLFVQVRILVVQRKRNSGVGLDYRSFFVVLSKFSVGMHHTTYQAI